MLLKRSLPRVYASDAPAMSQRANIHDVREGFFKPPNAVLCGAWDALEIRPAERGPGSRDDTFFIDRRLRLAFGPLHSKLDLDEGSNPVPNDVWATFLDVARRPLLAYMELRLTEAVLAWGGVKAIDLAMRMVENCCGKCELLQFVGLGHADVVVILGGRSQNDLMDVVMSVRSHTVGDMLKRNELESNVVALLDPLKDNHLYMTTSTSIGYFGGSYHDFDKVAENVERDEIARLFPSFRCTLHTGHEAHIHEVIGSESNVPAPVVEITTGAFDLRISPPPEIKRSGEVLRWYIKQFRRLIDREREAVKHVRSLDTTWGRIPESRSEYKEHGTPPQIRRITSSKEAVHVLADLESLLEPLARSDMFARYLVDVCDLFDALRSIETTQKGNWNEYDLQTLARRMMFVVLSRLVGATPWGEDLVLGHFTGSQKIAMAIGRIADHLIDIFYDTVRPRPVLLVGLTSLRKDRATIFGIRGTGHPQIALIELGIKDDFHESWRDVLFTLLHEAAHVVEIPSDMRLAFEQSLASDIAREAFQWLPRELCTVTWEVFRDRFVARATSDTDAPDSSVRSAGVEPVIEARKAALGERRALDECLRIDVLADLAGISSLGVEQLQALAKTVEALKEFGIITQSLANEWRTDTRVLALIGEVYANFLRKKLSPTKNEDTSLMWRLQVLDEIAEGETPLMGSRYASLRAWLRIYHCYCCRMVETAAGQGLPLERLRTLVQNETLSAPVIDGLLEFAFERLAHFVQN